MHDLFPVQYAWLIPLLPLIGALLAGFLGARWRKGQSHWPIWLGVGASAVLSIWLLVGMIGIWQHPSEAPAELREAFRYENAHSDNEAISSGWKLNEPELESINELAVSKTWFHWVTIGKFNADAGALIDPLTAVMLCVVTGIGFFITVFSAGYMKGEEGYWRFFSYLGLFIFSMTCLVMGNNLLMLYLGWEGVGVCSYLLIGYYYNKPAAREAAKKAFLVNRVGDWGFGLGIMLSFFAFGTISYFGTTPGGDGLLELARSPGTEFQRHALQWIPFLLMLGAFGKSAQFPLYVWLPDAMEGPTPVSALIHAATMVTAGVYMIARCGTLFVGNAAAMWTVAVIGAFTAVFAATIALRQFDLKKVFAYSTISQLGFMFVGVGVLAPVAGVFHLVTHAFFKALLFLSCGVVMHAMAGELNMRKFSGLKKQLPWTRWMMLIGCLALAGFPLFSGFFSKDEIIAASWEHSKVLALVMLFAAFLTAYYTFRLYFRVFEGPEILPEPQPHHAPDADEHLAPGHGHGGAVADAHGAHGDHAHHNHEPMLMILPLVVLAIGAIFAGFLNFPERHFSLGGFLGHSPSFQGSYALAAASHPMSEINPIPFGQLDVPLDADTVEYAHSVHVTMMIVSALVALFGIYLAYLIHLRDRPRAERIAQRYGGITRVLEAKYWVDEIYQNGIVEPLRAFGRAMFAVDRFLIDGFIGALGFIPQLSGFVLKLTTQRGYLQGYAVTMLFGIAVILLLIFL
jgi:NADH-quinone oxidoreductase subunit L